MKPLTGGIRINILLLWNKKLVIYRILLHFDIVNLDTKTEYWHSIGRYQIILTTSYKSQRFKLNQYYLRENILLYKILYAFECFSLPNQYNAHIYYILYAAATIIIIASSKCVNNALSRSTELWFTILSFST